MMAPVVGSGDWPAWMARVEKPCRFAFMSVRSRMQPEMVEHVDARDEALEAPVADDRRHHAALKEAHHTVDILAGVDHLEVARHGIPDRTLETARAMHPGKQVLLVEKAHEPVVLQHGELR